MQLIRKALTNLRIIGVDATIKSEIYISNTARVLFTSGIAVVLHLFFALNLFFKRDIIENKTYLLTVIASHVVMLIVMIISGSVALAAHTKKIKNTGIVNKISYIVALLYMLLGVVISLFANLLYPNISAFTIMCIGVTVCFLFNPLVSIIGHSIIFCTFAFTLPVFQPDIVMLVTQRSNSFAIVLISIFVSVLLWNYNVRLLEQKKLIEQQKDELQEKNESNEYLATHDKLTGILNRAHFQNLGDIEIQRLKQRKGYMSLIIADIDYFKNINDRYGHPVGDTILKEFSGLLENNTRKTDIVARLGGEEFVVLLPEISIDEAKEKAESLRKIIETYKFSSIPESDPVTASFGVVGINTTVDDPLIEGYRNADLALYRAKQQGRNRVVVF